MLCPAQTIVYMNLSIALNKSVLNWTYMCQLHWETQLQETYYVTKLLMIEKSLITLASVLGLIEMVTYHFYIFLNDLLNLIVVNLAQNTRLTFKYLS